MIGKKPQAWAAAWTISTSATGQNEKIVGYDCGPELGFVTLGRETSRACSECFFRQRNDIPRGKARESPAA